MAIFWISFRKLSVTFNESLSRKKNGKYEKTESNV